MKIPGYIQEVINNQEMHILSTATRDGIPNIIYLKFLKVYDDSRILIANNRFYKTEKNLLENPLISFVVWDKENRKSYQIKGAVEIHRDDIIFEETIKWVEKERPNPAIFPKSAVILNVQEIYCGAEKLSEQ